ncbi:MAG: DNA polymerase III subunit delta [Elusimicrobia bacterium RIFOXYD2_FULL_34_30]|nr:MAG: DNA polymerase III subunit delta [Elusimicrobia bacterium RIFOXYD2_FULL_34_30]
MSLIKYQEFKSKLKSLKKSFLSPVYLFYGAEDYLKNETVSFIESIIIEPSIKDLNYSIFYFGDKNNSEISIETVLQSANSYPFVSDKKLVIVKNINKLPESQDNLLETYIDNPSTTSCLILIGTEKLPKRVLFKKIENMYPTVNFYHLFEHEIRHWIVEEIKLLKKNISYSAAEMLFNITGRNLADIRREIDKLILYTDVKSEITLEDVESCCGYFKENTIFELLPVLARKELHQAIKILINLFSNGENEFAILSTISDRYKKYLKFYEVRDKGIAESEAITQAGINFYQKDFLKDVKLIKKENILDSLEKILNTELGIKSGKNSKIQIEKLLFELCKPASQTGNLS